MRRQLPLLLLLPLLLAACGNALPPAPTTPRQALVQVALAYNAASQAALVYAHQPACGSAAAKPPPACSEPAIVGRMGQASEAARAAMRAAAAVINAPTTPEAQAEAVEQAKAAIAALTALTGATQEAR